MVSLFERNDLNLHLGRGSQSSLEEEPHRERKGSPSPVVSNHPQEDTVELQQETPSLWDPSKRKCSQDEEPEFSRPSKQPRRHASEYDELSEKNLIRLEEMNAAVNNTRPGSIKRASSLPSTTGASETTQETTRTQRSSSTQAFYRFTHLAAARVYIHADAPKDIQEAVDIIIKAEPTKERQDQLKPIAQALHEDCTKASRAAVGKDDFVGHFQSALKAMEPNKLCLREKADWHEDLKPKIQRSRINLDFLTDRGFVDRGQNQEVGDDSAAPPPKRLQQSVGQAYISPNSSIANESYPSLAKRSLESGTMPPSASFPLPKKEEGRSLIKTPRPDISIGTEYTALISALSTQNINRTLAELFLTKLQEQMVLRDPGGPEEPALISVPALRASDLVFPFAVVEGKAYSTGKQVFEAENQAAVSGACGLKIQLCLDELVKRATPESSNDDESPTSSDSQSAPSKNQPVLFFSICTEGPIHELWVHWTIVEHDVRKFNMKLLKLCHAALLDGVEDFIIAVDNMLRWGTGPFVDSVVERLGKVARASGL